MLINYKKDDECEDIFVEKCLNLLYKNNGKNKEIVV